MKALVDKLVIVTHSFMMDRHQIARVVAQTAKTVQINHWNSRTQEWDDKLQRRNIDAVIRILGPSNATPAIIEGHERYLRNIHDLYLDAAKKARKTYFDRISSQGEPSQ